MLSRALQVASICAIGSLLTAPAVAESVSGDFVQKYIDAMFGKASPEWKQRVTQDETQRTCSEHRNDPPPAEASKILAREKATVVFPVDGILLGDWKAGEKVAQSGQGGQFTDNDKTANGGNCYACHQLAPMEVSYGTLGPSLLAYGKVRGFSPDEAKTAYAKIYNAQSLTACSLMPRFGYHKFLSEQQLKDVLAYLFDPQSPVNK
jgi:sulfur-oxidizing protein SoxX